VAGSPPRLGRLPLPAAFLLAQALAFSLGAAYLAVQGDLAPGLPPLIAAVPWAAFLVSLCLGRLAPSVRLELLPAAVGLNVIGLFVLSVVAPAFAQLQCLWSIISLSAYGLVSRCAGDARRLRQLSGPLFLISLGLVLLTFAYGVNPSGGARRQWIALGPAYFEPSELLKLALALLLSLQLSGTYAAVGKRRPWAYAAVAVSLLVLTLQGDLGAALMVALIGALVIFAASGRWQRLLLGLAAVAAGGAVAYAALPYVRVRFDTWLDPWSDPAGASYQIVQGARALAAGGLTGRGLLAAETVHVPASHTDSIIAALGERLGLVGSVTVVGLYGVMLAQLRRVYLRAGSALEALLATAVATLLVGQAIVILGGSTGLVPLTGVTLPLVSYGGSSLLMSYLALALIGGRRNETVDASSPVHTRGQSIVHLALALALALVTVWLSAWHLAGTTIIEHLAGS